MGRCIACSDTPFSFLCPFLLCCQAKKGRLNTNIKYLFINKGHYCPFGLSWHKYAASGHIKDFFILFFGGRYSDYGLVLGPVSQVQRLSISWSLWTISWCVHGLVLSWDLAKTLQFWYSVLLPQLPFLARYSTATCFWRGKKKPLCPGFVEHMTVHDGLLSSLLSKPWKSLSLITLNLQDCRLFHCGLLIWLSHLSPLPTLPPFKWTEGRSEISS